MTLRFTDEGTYTKGRMIDPIPLNNPYLVLARFIPRVTNPKNAAAVAEKATSRFGRIDVLVNNAANFYGGFFEELGMDQIEKQIQTSLMGPIIVTRAILPVMRKQKAGLIISISSTAGLTSYGVGSGFKTFKELCPKSKVLEGFEIRGE
jgi:NADP-dependent 3-hydroxy acid dehydrogenase YdfG